MIIKGEQTVIEYLAEYIQAQLNINKYNYDFFVHTSIGEYKDSGRKTRQGTVSNTLNCMLRNLGNGTISPLTSIMSYSDAFFFEVDVRQEDADKIKKILENFTVTNNDAQINVDSAVLIVNSLSVADGQAQIGSPNGGQITYAFQINVAVVQGAVYDTKMTYEIKTGTMEYVEIPAERIDDIMGLTASSATTNYTGKGKQNPAQAIGQISVYLSFLDNDVIEQIVKDVLSRNSKRKYTIKASYKNTDYAYDYYLGGSSAKIIKSKGKIIGIEATFVEAF